MAASRPAVEVARLAAGPEHAAQIGSKGAGSTPAPTSAAIASADRVGLLGRDPSLLDRERGDVADREDPLEADRPAVLVDADEAVGVVGNPGDPPALEARQADHRVGLDLLARRDPQPALLELDRVGAGDDLDPALLQQLAHLLGGATAEELEWRVLGGDDREPRAPAVAPWPARSRPAAPARRAAAPSCARRAS